MLKLVAPTLAMALAAALCTPALAQNRIIGAASAPIAQAVFVPAGSDTLYVSGLTPDVINLGPDGKLPKGVTAQFGDTETQVRSILKKIEATLTGEGFTLGDVVMMRIVLVGDPAKGGVMDREGMMKAYLEKFANPAQPKKPARITTQIAGLGVPGMMAEIEVQAARPAK